MNTCSKNSTLWYPTRDRKGNALYTLKTYESFKQEKCFNTIILTIAAYMDKGINVFL